MARRTITIDEKIEKAEAAVIAVKAKYDAALDELEKLVTKRKEMDDYLISWNSIFQGVSDLSAVRSKKIRSYGKTGSGARV